MVGVEVRDEDARRGPAARRAQQLALRALAAVEQQPVAAAAHEQRGQPAARASGTEPPVPAKKTSRSISGECSRRAAERRSPPIAVTLRGRVPCHPSTRARSSVDRALASGARGRRFESCRARRAIRLGRDCPPGVTCPNLSVQG